MKRIQMLKAAIVAVAIGGAFASKASSRQMITRFTLNGMGFPCNPINRPCMGNMTICNDVFPTNTQTYYHQLSSNLCGKILMEDKH